MNYTSLQKKVLNYLGLAKVSYSKTMWTKYHQLGYVTPDKPTDKIHIAKDFPDLDVQKLALLHECGHVYFGHTGVDTKKEILFVKDLFKTLNKPYSLIRTYGGPMTFLNVCMDLEVNSKLFTLSNVKKMNEYVKICMPDVYEVPVLDDFRDYYKPLIEKLSNNDEEMEQLKQMIKDSLDSLKSDGSAPSMEDISNGVQVFDEDFDEELSDELSREKYQSGDKKKVSEKSSDSDEESTVEDVSDQIDKEVEKKEQKECSTPGSNHSLYGKHELKENSSKTIKAFLNSIIKTSMNYQPDSLRHYNRGTRVNSKGILYTSLRRKAQTDKPRLGVLIDVSGSMATDSIITACKTLQESVNLIDNNSLVVTWDTRKCEEFLITKVPDSVYSGGGTDMFAGLKYLTEEKHCDKVVIYSDFETEIEPMTELIKKKHLDVYSICTMDEGNWLMNDSEFNEYLKLNKRHIFVTND